MAHPELDVWMNGEYVGAWFWTRTGAATLRYDDGWLRSPNMRALSLSLPIPAGAKELRGAAVENYFDNLLPDSDRIRERLRRRFRAPTTQAADLLAAIGRDCVGAVQLLPAGQAPAAFDRVDSEPLTTAQVEQTLRNVTADPVLGQGDDQDDFRISIAGAQEKTALLRIGDQWHRPHGATPTTHILKLPLGLVGNMRANMTDSVENEWLCARLMAALGFDVAHTEMGRFGDQRALIVERFDRRWMDNGRWIARLPQEDFCQATGTAAQLKYESDGGPGMRDCLSLLAASDEARADRLRFVLTQLAFWLLAATDGHAKNYSIFLRRGGGYAMTPLYDMLSAWPIIGKGPSQVPWQKAKLAMALRSKNAHFTLAGIQTRHWQVLAAQSGVDGAFQQMTALVRHAPAALAQIESSLPSNFPERVWRTVDTGVRAQCQRFESGLKDASETP
ncbi:type II toxin-antitoxin system HipA family toxin [Variovorax sp. J22R133]|uniref:type II toxin-antitoxin system HipA family toxin n=1 Tax=Variovorax brevis TaxID=3053503 RepID=UPI002575253F|nr:type II toxin-antitoxin system HipA family toxin [Variovorax sp. J22R133]MDM0112524.1 type II toxin-antitoxin system HipA family toxin [Variovorax sp. J22R133]